MEDINISSLPVSILFVDDDEQILNALKRLTRVLKERVFLCQDSREAMNIIKSEHIDIVVSDYRMPNIDGISLLSEISNNYPEIIRIMLTGNADVDVMLGAINNGRIWGFIEKPWQGAQLLSTLKQAVQTRHLLRSRVNNLYQELEVAKVKADAGLQAKSEFLAVMSHEIRTPMNALLGSLELLRETKLDKKQKQLLNNASSSGEALFSVVNNVLDISKIEAGKLKLNKSYFPTLSIVDYLHEIFNKAASEKGLALHFCISPQVSNMLHLDQQRLNQILINLISNALKFTEEGGIEVSINLRDKLLAIDVIDTGIGIKESDLSSLFEKFSQADSSYQRQYEGTGLGLSISRELLELMGGDICVTSKLGEGSKFSLKIPHDYFCAPLFDKQSKERQSFSLVNFSTFSEQAISKQLRLLNCKVSLIQDNTLPKQICLKGDYLDANSLSEALSENVKGYRYTEVIKQFFEKQAANNKQCVSPKVPLKGNKQHILVVEDSRPNQIVAKTLLENANYIVEIANDGLEAIDLISNKHFDLVLMDLSMPKLDGASACVRIRNKNGKYQSLPIWAMTANVAEKDKQYCFDAGMNDFVEKPIKKDQLLTKLFAFFNESATDNNNKKENKLICDEVVTQLISDTGQEVFNNILSLFINETNSRMDSMVEGLKNQNYTLLKDESHAVKSSAATIGAIELSNLAIEIETQAGLGALEPLKTLVNKMPDLASDSFLALQEKQ